MKRLFFPVLILLTICASISAQTKSINLDAANPAGTNTPVRKLSFEEVKRYVQNDSLASENKSLETRSASADIVIGEMLLGPLSGVIAAIPTALLFSAISDHIAGNNSADNSAWGAVGAGAGYIAGTGLGVYLIASHDNPNVTFVGTIAGSLLGAAAGVALTAITSDKKYIIPPILTLSSPVIGSMIYANFIAPHPQAAGNSSSMENYRSLALSYSHKDLYNSTLQYRMNLFTIAF